MSKVHAAHPRLPGELLGARIELARETPRRSISVDGLAELPPTDAVPELQLWANRHRAVFSHDRIGDFDVLNGTAIVIHPRPGVDVERLRAMLQGIVATFLLGQQGRFALHASTVEIAGHRVAISGPSGAGKSTTAVRLAQRGATPVVDDVTVLDVDNGVATTASWGRDAHIWPHVADELDVDLSGAVMRGGERAKWALSWPAVAERPVQDVVVLRRAQVPEPVIDTLPPLATLHMLGRCVHFRHRIREVWPEEVFAWEVELSRSVRIARLRRPPDEPTLERVCDLIESWVGNEPVRTDQP